MSEVKPHKHLAASGGWQPIETAPATYKVLVVEASGYRSIARQEFNRKMELFWLDDSNRCVPSPTHWQPLPDPPQLSSKEK